MLALSESDGLSRQKTDLLELASEEQKLAQHKECLVSCNEVFVALVDASSSVSLPVFTMAGSMARLTGHNKFGNFQPLLHFSFD